jgi:hypothetical protein
MQRRDLTVFPHLAGLRPLQTDAAMNHLLMMIAVAHGRVCNPAAML